MKHLAPARYKVTFTASAELRDKLKRLQALMRSSVADGDLAVIIEEAVTEKLEKLESRRYGKTKAPRKSLEETDTSPSSRYIPAAEPASSGRCTRATVLNAYLSTRTVVAARRPNSSSSTTSTRLGKVVTIDQPISN